MQTRKAQVRNGGAPEVLQIMSTALTDPSRNRVRVHVETAGVAYGDIMRRKGAVPVLRAFTPGYDVVGVIDAVGANIDNSWLGKRVGVIMPVVGYGGYSEHVFAPTKALVEVPDGMTADTAAALGLNYISAYQIIHRVLRLTAGQSLLVHGAAGGVGTALLDVGRAAGLTLYGTASAKKHDVVRDRGATPIDYRSEDFVQRIAELTEDGVDAVTDPIGGDHLYESHAALKPGGTLMMFGVSGDVNGGPMAVVRGFGPIIKLLLRPNGRRMRIYGFGAPLLSPLATCREDWAKLLALGAKGEIEPLIGARFSLDQAADAHELLERAGVVGKVLLNP